MAVREYTEAALLPILQPFIKTYAAHKVQRLYGFWLCWHVSGGRAGMVAGGWSVPSINRQKVEFRQVFKTEVEDAWPEVVEFMRGQREQG